MRRRERYSYRRSRPRSRRCRPMSRWRRARPVAFTNSTAASTLGPIEPAGKLPASSSVVVARSSLRWFGVPQSVYTPSTSVAITYRSASRSRASRLPARSLSTTASTPTSWRFSPRAYMVGMPPPPAQMISTPCSSSHFRGRSSKMRSGRRRGHHAAPVVAIGLDRPALVGCQGLGGGLVVDRSNELGRVAEGRVVGVHLDHGQDGGQRHLEGQHIAQLLLQQVADHALRLGAQDVQWIGLDVRIGRRLQRQQPDLRAVAVRHDQLMRAWRPAPALAPRCGYSCAAPPRSWPGLAGSGRCRPTR